MYLLLLAVIYLAFISLGLPDSLLGSTFMPPVFGIIANHISLKLMPIYLAFFLVLLLIMILKTEKLCRSKGNL